MHRTKKISAIKNVYLLGGNATLQKFTPKTGGGGGGGGGGLWNLKWEPLFFLFQIRILHSEIRKFYSRIFLFMKDGAAMAKKRNCQLFGSLINFVELNFKRKID